MSCVSTVTGNLSLRIIQARDIHSRSACTTVYIGQDDRTIHARNDGDENPHFDQTVHFNLKNCSEKTIKIVVKHKNFLGAWSTGVVRLPIFIFLREYKGWLPFYRSESHRKRIGDIFIESNFEGAGGLPTRFPPQYGLIEAYYGVSSCSLDVMPILQSKIHSNQLVIPKKLSLREFIGIDALPGSALKALKIIYMNREGKTVEIAVPEDPRKHDVVLDLKKIELGDRKHERVVEKFEEKKIQEEKEEAERVTAVESARVQKAAISIDPKVAKHIPGVEKVDEPQKPKKNERENKESAEKPAA